MAIFAPRTYTEIMSDMLARLISSTPLNDINYGSVWTLMLEAAAQEDDEQYFQMLEIIRGYSIDNIDGEDLENRALEYGLEKRLAASASTTVTLGDSAITKVETEVYSGLSGAAAGSTSVNGNAATGFPTSGAIIVGRGTSNIEIVNYSSIDTLTNHVRFNLTSQFANDHGTDETIILSQGGDRTISAGTVVRVPASDQLESVGFSLDDDEVILDGESEVTEVPVTATAVGVGSNVPIGSISLYDSKPFSTAIVNNPERVTNGLAEETDDALRDRIKDHIQSLSRGTPRAIITGVSGLVSESDNKRVTSVFLRDATVPTDVVKLFIDDGTGFISDFSRVGYEEVVAAATGGERYLKAANTPMVKASVETQNEEPYNIPNNSTLFIEISGAQETVTFVDSDFAVPGAATAQEVLEKINSSSSTYESRLSAGGTKVRIFSRENVGEEIRCSGGTANTALNFQTDLKFTSKLYLYRDHVLSLLSKDGKVASIESGATAVFNVNTYNGHLSLILDSKIANIINVWIKPTSFIVPASVNALEMSEVINAQLPGAVCEPSSADTRVTISSNSEKSADSKVRVVENFSKIFSEELGANVDRTTDLQNAGADTPVFAALNDYMYFGHDDVAFNSIAIAMTAGATDIIPVFEYWSGSSWTEFSAFDGTEGLSQSGVILFPYLHRWLKTSVEGYSAYWIRIQRTQAAATSPSINRARVCLANELLQFSESEAVGSPNNYLLNRFVGQIELTETLEPGDKLTFGSSDTRALVVSAIGTFNGLAATDLDLDVDGVSKSITFQLADFADDLAATATEVAAAINDRVGGVLASTVESGSRVKIATNTINGGSIQIAAGGANGILSFPTDLIENFISHRPGMESDAGPYVFNRDDYILSVVDDDVSNTFTVPLFKQADLTGVTSSTIVVDTELYNSFPFAANLQDYKFIMVGGDLEGQSANIDSYVPGTGVLTLDTPLILNEESEVSRFDITDNGTDVDGKYLTIYDAAGSVAVWVDSNLEETEVTRFRINAPNAWSGAWLSVSDDVGTVAFWIDLNDGSPTTEPIHGKNRSVEITTIIAADDNATFSGKIAAAINADSKFSATIENGNEIVVTSATPGARLNGTLGNFGGAFWIDNEGVDYVPTTEPTHGKDRSIKVSTILGADSDTTVTSKIGSALHADSEFTVTSDLGDILVTSVDPGARADGSIGTMTGTFSVENEGVTETIASSGDAYQVIPKTASQVVEFWNNRQVTLISTKTEVSLSSGGTKVQLSSLQTTEDAAIAVPGGSGNSELNFQLEERGVDAYRHFTGLAQETQWAVDGNEAEGYDGIRAAGVHVEVIEPVKKPQTIEVKITTDSGVSLSSITNTIKSVISNYINGLGVSDDVIMSEVIVEVKTVAGVFDATIAGSSCSSRENVAIADNELARITEDNITVG